MADYMDDDMDETGGPSFAVGASGGLGSYQKAYDQQLQSLNSMYAAAEKALRARQGGGDESMRRERLFALAAALGQPTRTGSFGETLGNFSSALAGTLKSQRERKEALEDKLLDQQQARALLANKLYTQYIVAANKPQWARTQDPITGEVTVTPVYPGQAGATSGVPEELPSDFFD
jgi:hypothetical protein